MRAVLIFIVVTVIAYFVALVAGLALAERLGMSNFEGAAATQVAFLFAPAAALAVGGMVTAWRVRQPAQPRARDRADTATRGLRVTIAGVLLGYGAGWLVRWLAFEGMAFQHYWQAWIVSVLPYLGAAASGAVAYVLTAANRKREI